PGTTAISSGPRRSTRSWWTSWLRRGVPWQGKSAGGRGGIGHDPPPPSSAKCDEGPCDPGDRDVPRTVGHWYAHRTKVSLSYLRVSYEPITGPSGPPSTEVE